MSNFPINFRSNQTLLGWPTRQYRISRLTPFIPLHESFNPSNRFGSFGPSSKLASRFSKEGRNTYMEAEQRVKLFQPIVLQNSPFSLLRGHKALECGKAQLYFRAQNSFLWAWPRSWRIKARWWGRARRPNWRMRHKLETDHCYRYFLLWFRMLHHSSLFLI